MNLCPACGKPLLVRYDLAQASQTLTRDSLAGRAETLWRYEEVLPVRRRDAIISLGEGWTPLLAASRLGASIGCAHTYIKDEGLNPTGSFKARGQAVAVSRALELGVTALAVPSAGNAAGAMSAYAAAAGLAASSGFPPARGAGWPADTLPGGCAGRGGSGAVPKAGYSQCVARPIASPAPAPAAATANGRQLRLRR